MTRVVLTTPAEDDTFTILEGLALDAGADVADRYAADFAKFYGRLAQFPEIAALRSQLGRDVRMSVIRPYLVFHRFQRSADCVTVLRILHGKRRVTRRHLGQN